MLPLPDFTSDIQRPEIHGHRGCRGLMPENTLPAFLYALALGVDVLELDVIISADKQVVVSHEPWLAAHLGTGPAGQAIDPRQERTYNLYHMFYATIRQCVVGNKLHPGFPEQQLVASYRPLLREVLIATEAACHHLKRPLVGYSVEIKSSEAGDDIFHPAPAAFVELVLAELRAAAVLTRTTILSFDYRVLQYAREIADCPALCLLNETNVAAEVLFAQLGFVPTAFGPAFRQLSTAVAQELVLRFPKLRIVPWTVNEVVDLEEVLTWPIAGITTDYPNRLGVLLTG